MDASPFRPYQFHKTTSEAYLATHRWLSTIPLANGYRQLSYEQAKSLLKEKSLLSAASQFRVFFPPHFFKVIHTLNAVVNQDYLVNWLNRNPRVCIIDIGCGAGASSTAFIETVLRLQESKKLTSPIQLFCIGVDPNAYAIAIYDHFLTQMIEKASSDLLQITYVREPEGIPNVTGWIIDRLNKMRQEWDLPFLPHVIVMQVNILSPLNDDHERRQDNFKILTDLGVTIDSDEEQYQRFGSEESLAYKSIFENVKIDHLHVFTVSTDHYLLDQRVLEMGQAIAQIFSNDRHKVQTLGQGEHKTTFINPVGCHFERNRNPHTSTFHVNISSITNQELQGDKDWHEVISEDNLRLAWAKTRQGLLREAFVDEIEIRLFERNLDSNLAQMRQQLLAYAEDLAHTDDIVAYKVPKSESKVRPRGLSRMEEELLSVAIIQKLGNEISRLHANSFAYQISNKSRGRDTEYLYTHWFYAHKAYLDAARSEAQKSAVKAVIRTDVKDFYTKIIRDQLLEIVTPKLTRSNRIEWLLRLLLSKDLDDHEVGRGIVQGSLGSGFLANIYLSSVDAIFGRDESVNEWGARFFRFVDDMIIVIPKPETGRLETVIDEILQAIRSQLSSLGLELNEDKTDVYDDLAEFLSDIEPDTTLEQLDDEYQKLTNGLWITNSALRSKFIDCASNDDLWWYRIRQYCQCLQHLSIFVSPPLISRRIYKYLFDQQTRRNDLKRQRELEIPDLLTTVEAQTWTDDFEIKNPSWVVERDNLREKFSVLLKSSWETLKAETSLSPSERRKTETRIRFSLNKLAVLGYESVINTVLELLTQEVWVIREPLRTLESLAQQGYSSAISAVLEHYESNTVLASKYLRSITLRAMRFLPHFEPSHLEAIAKYALTGSKEERLMATETWIYLLDRPLFIPNQTQLDHMRTLLVSNPTLSTRLKKNYLLLIGYNKTLPRDFDIDQNDLAMVGAFETVLGGEVSDLLAYEEPEIIRENYYSGQPQQDTEYDYPT